MHSSTNLWSSFFQNATNIMVLQKLSFNGWRMWWTFLFRELECQVVKNQFTGTAVWPRNGICAFCVKTLRCHVVWFISCRNGLYFSEIFCWSGPTWIRHSVDKSSSVGSVCLSWTAGVFVFILYCSHLQGDFYNIVVTTWVKRSQVVAHIFLFVRLLRPIRNIKVFYPHKRLLTDVMTNAQGHSCSDRKNTTRLQKFFKHPPKQHTFWLVILYLSHV